MQAFMLHQQEIKSKEGAIFFEIRIGINSGAVDAGVLICV
jgi:class 3 adenylate cyclase